MLGPTTVLSRTEIDATGTSNDAERVSESRRDLKQAPELRRLVKYRQGVAIIDTADPILFRFLPRGDIGDVAVPPVREIDLPEPLADAVAAMERIKDAEKRQSLTENGGRTASIVAAGVVTTAAVEQSRALTKAMRNPVDIACLSEPELPFDEAV
jgi:hypothetical protein